LIFLFNKTYGFSAIHANPLPAPQANLIATLANSIFLGDIKWNEIVVGIFLGVIARMLNFSVLAFGVGVYLPQALSIPILLGGIFSNFIKDILNKKADNKESNLENEEKVNLVASGLIAGDTILGLLIVFLIAFNVLPSEDGESIFQSFSPFLSLLAFSLVLFLVYHILVKKR